MSKNNIIKIVGGVVLAVLILVPVIGYFVYQNSPQKAYLEFSNAVRDNDNEKFTSLIDCDEFSKNFLDGLAAENGDFDCEEEVNLAQTIGGDSDESQDPLSESFKSEDLANNIIEAYTNDSFFQKGDEYRLETQLLNLDSEEETEVIFVFSRVDNQWKITDFEIPEIEALLQAFSGFTNPDFDEEYSVAVGEEIKQNDKIYTLVEYDTIKTAEGVDFLDEPVSETAVDGKVFARFLIKRENTDIENASFSLPTYELIDPEGNSTDNLSWFDEDNIYEDIDDLEDSIPAEYAQIEEDTRVTSEPDGFPEQVVFFDYVFFEIDEGTNLADYQLQLSESFIENTYRVTIELE